MCYKDTCNWHGFKVAGFFFYYSYCVRNMKCSNTQNCPKSFNFCIYTMNMQLYNYTNTANIRGNHITLHLFICICSHYSPTKIIFFRVCMSHRVLINLFCFRIFFSNFLFFLNFILLFTSALTNNSAPTSYTAPDP